MDPRKRFSSAKASQLLTQVVKEEGSFQSYGIGILISTTIGKHHVCYKNMCHPLTLDLLVLVYVSIGKSADPN